MARIGEGWVKTLSWALFLLGSVAKERHDHCCSRYDLGACLAIALVASKAVHILLRENATFRLGHHLENYFRPSEDVVYLDRNVVFKKLNSKKKNPTSKFTNEALQLGDSVPEARVFVNGGVVSKFSGSINFHSRPRGRNIPEGGVVDLINTKAGLHV